MVIKIIDALKACNPLNHKHIMLQREDVIGPGERSVMGYLNTASNYCTFAHLFKLLGHRRTIGYNCQ